MKKQRDFEYTNIIWKGRPHLLSFWWFYLILIYETALAVWGLDIIYSESNGSITAEINSFVLWNMAVIFPMILLTFSKIQFRWMVVGTLYVFSEIYFEAYSNPEYLRNILLIFVFMGLIWIEYHRRCYNFYVSKSSILLKYRGFKKWYRSVSLTHISDLVLEKGIIGKLSNVGNIIPISNSGFGIGENSLLAGTTLSGGIFPRIQLGGIFGSIRTQQHPRSEPQFILYGIKRPEIVYELINKNLTSR